MLQQTRLLRNVHVDRDAWDSGLDGPAGQSRLDAQPPSIPRFECAAPMMALALTTSDLPNTSRCRRKYSSI